MSLTDDVQTSLTKPLKDYEQARTGSANLEELGLTDAFSYYAEATSVRGTSSEDEVFVWGTPALGETRPRRHQTRSARPRGYTRPLEDETFAGDVTLREDENQDIETVSDDLDETPEDPVWKMGQDRLALLARKYAAKGASKEKFADEEYARLLIITERMRRLMPAITKTDMAAMDEIVTVLEGVERTEEEVRARWAIK